MRTPLARCVVVLLAALLIYAPRAALALGDGPVLEAQVNVNCGGSGISSLYCIPQQSVFAFTRVSQSPRCSLAVAFTVEPQIEGLHGRAHLLLRELSGSGHIWRDARPRVSGGAYTVRFLRLDSGAYALSGWYGGDGTRLPSAHRTRRVTLSCAVRARARVARARRRHGREQRGRTQRAPSAALPLKMIWGPLTLPDGTSAFPTYHQLGVQVLQLELTWNAVALARPAQPTNPADPAYRWPAAIEQAIAEAARYRIQIAVMVRATPAWANGGRGPAWAPEDPADYANFTAAASRRYPSVRYWMIWGEPTRAGNFEPMPANSPVGPQRYALLLEAAYGALKAINPANVVIGGMTYTVGLDSPSQFIHWMRLPNGRPPRLDYYGHNPYSTRFPDLAEGPYNPTVRDINDIDTLHAELARAYRGRRGGPPKLWLSEYSISSERANRAFSYFVSDAEQAKWLTAAFKLVDSTNYVAGLGWYELLDEPPTESGALTEGLMTSTGAPKPAFAAYQHAP
jgi:hypothetical protein